VLFTETNSGTTLRRIRGVADTRFVHKQNGGFLLTIRIQQEVSSTILADIMYLVPACFDDAEEALLEAALDFECG
jgi:hypothetical protein